MEISSNAKKVNVEEAKNIILKGLSVLGNEYINNLKKAFDEK
jgi:oligoendopeptidase F